MTTEQAEVEELRYTNHYEHCGRIWTDQWSCMCNDRCPACGHEIEPFKSLDLVEDEIFDWRS